MIARLALALALAAAAEAAGLPTSISSAATRSDIVETAADCLPKSCAHDKCPASHPVATAHTTTGCCFFWTGPCQTCCSSAPPPAPPPAPDPPPPPPPPSPPSPPSPPGPAVDCNDKYKSKSTCDADPACAWCTSAAVPAACNTLKDAKGLPPSVFKCDKI